MHFEFLVEDQSGKVMLELLLPRILKEEHTHHVHNYKGIGGIPKGLKASSDANKRILLDQLPRLLAGYGNAFANYGPDYEAAVVVVCDLDTRDRSAFEHDLAQVAKAIHPCPKHAFCLAVEEGEAWFLGDFPALLGAYPRAKQPILNKYINDSICGTWELLADAIHVGGAKALEGKGWIAVGTEKSRWAENITPHMTPATNKSPSFARFIAALENLAGKSVS